MVGEQSSAFHSVPLARIRKLPYPHFPTAEFGPWFQQYKEPMSQSSADDEGSSLRLRRGRRQKWASQKAEDILNAGEAVPGVSPDRKVCPPINRKSTNGGCTGINHVADYEIQSTLPVLDTPFSATSSQVSFLHHPLPSYHPAILTRICSNPRWPEHLRWYREQGQVRISQV